MDTILHLMVILVNTDPAADKLPTETCGKSKLPRPVTKTDRQVMAPTTQAQLQQRAGTPGTSRTPCLVDQAAVTEKTPAVQAQTPVTMAQPQLNAGAPYTSISPHLVTWSMAAVTQPVKLTAGTMWHCPRHVKSRHKLQAGVPCTPNLPHSVTPKAVTTLPARMKAGTPSTLEPPCLKAHVLGTTPNKEGQAPSTRPPWRGTGHTTASVQPGGVENQANRLNKKATASGRVWGAGPLETSDINKARQAATGNPAPHQQDQTDPMPQATHVIGGIFLQGTPRHHWELDPCQLAPSSGIFCWGTPRHHQELDPCQLALSSEIFQRTPRHHWELDPCQLALSPGIFPEGPEHPDYTGSSVQVNKHCHRGSSQREHPDNKGSWTPLNDHSTAGMTCHWEPYGLPTGPVCLHSSCQQCPT
jgi:hypothetical protein